MIGHAGRLRQGCDSESRYCSAMGEAEIIAATAQPVTRGGITADLRTLGVTPGDVLVVHTSLSAMGWVVGGAQAVVEALLDAVGPKGTVTMPAHSADWSEPSNWEHPPVPADWWPVIRAECPAFDPALTQPRDMGAVADTLLRHPRAVRSVHPMVSHTAVGPHAEQITANHVLTDGFGDGSPIARLYDLDAKVLLLGVGHANNTSLHLAESRTEWPSKKWARQGSAMIIDGSRQWVEYDELDGDTDDFDSPDGFGPYFATTGHERVGTVGQAPSRLMAQRALVDAAVVWFREHRT